MPVKTFFFIFLKIEKRLCSKNKIFDLTWSETIHVRTMSLKIRSTLAKFTHHKIITKKIFAFIGH